MGTEPLTYFFDAQLRRYSMQFSRIFSNLKYQTGRTDPDGNPELRTVPWRFAIQNRQAAHIIRQVSENFMNSVPMFTFYISNLKPAPERRQDPFYTEKIQISQRKFDPNTGEYTAEMGQKFTLERYMPVPYNIEWTVDLWTSNMDQKMQLFEQIAVLFNPSINLQNSTDVYDWTALNLVELEGVNWSSRGVPVGIDSDIDLTSWTFSSYIHITPPAMLTPQKVIQQIVMNIGELNSMVEQGLSYGYDIHWDPTDLLGRIITTPGNHQIQVDGDLITLLNANGSLVDDAGQIFDWNLLIDEYGSVREDISQFRLKTSDDIEDFDTDIVGTFEYTDQPNVLKFKVDQLTLPKDTLDPINKIIDPHKVYPGNGLPVPAIGQRYMLWDEIGDIEHGNVAWGSIRGNKGDIIQYTSTGWTTVWTPNTAIDPVTGIITFEIITNITTGKKLKWNGKEWIFAIDGNYKPGYWRIFL